MLLLYNAYMKDTDLLKEIEPILSSAYESHMDSIQDRSNKDTTKRPFSPVEVLAKSAQTSTDPLEYGPILRSDFKQHIQDFEIDYEIDIKPIIMASFLINLLTEDNLPHYTSRIHSKVAGSEALMLFANEWTAEEDTHGVLMRDYALLSGLIGDEQTSLISNASYQKGRTNQLRSGTEINPTSLQSAFAYLSLQELLTKEAHKTEGWILPASGRKIMNPIAGDEQNHYEFYRTATQASLDADPDGTLIAINNTYGNFSMPGALGIPDFNNQALTIGLSGIFDLETIAKSMHTIAQKLNIKDTEPNTDAGKTAKENVLQITSIEAVEQKHQLMQKLRSSMEVKLNKNGLLPFILGKTIDFDYAGSAEHQKPVGLKPLSD